MILWDFLLRCLSLESSLMILLAFEEFWNQFGMFLSQRSGLVFWLVPTSREAENQVVGLDEVG